MYDDQFVIGQKAMTLRADINDHTTTRKPVLNTRDEPLYDGKDCFRLHVTSGDPNISPYATRLKIGSTQLVLDMVEQGWRNRDLLPKIGTAHLLAQQVAMDLTFERPFALAHATMKPIDMMKLFIDDAQKFLSARTSFRTRDNLWVIRNLRAVYEEFKNNPFAISVLDWPMRLRTINVELGKPKGALGDVTGMHDELARAADLQYDLISYDPEKRTTADIYRTKSWKRWMPDPELLESRKSIPPPGRARRRGKVVTDIKCRSIDWGYAKTTTGRVIHFGRPFDTDENIAA